MRWREALEPQEMVRVALLAPVTNLRAVLVGVADEGSMQLDDAAPGTELRPGTGTAAALLLRLRPAATVQPRLSRTAPDLDACERAGRVEIVAGEAELERRVAQVLVRGRVAGTVGWAPRPALDRLGSRIAPDGGALVPLARPAGVQPPTMLAPSGVAREFAPLVQTYATVPYADVDPSVLAGVAYVVMFGMMFADVGHGALLLLAAVAVRWGRRPWLRRLRPAALFLAGAGLASMVFGALYGEFFGPTGVLPVLWLDPLENPVQVLSAGVGVGAILLSAAFALGTVNRYREAGWGRAVYAPSGLAGAATFLGLGLLAGGLYLDDGWLVTLGVVVGVSGLVTAFAGLVASSGGGGAGIVEAVVELFDLVVRLGANLISFARLAAFGLTHAALGAVVWLAASSRWGAGAGAAVAVLIFVVGNALAFMLEGLVAGVQALRLEYYELFSRVFDVEGVPFRPWHVPLETAADRPEEVPC